ncbi:serine hydrolase domain-containing protein [Streptomyces sp. NPDC001927]
MRTAGAGPSRNAPGALAEAVHDLAEIAPAAAPGETYAYSSAGYAVLGALIEEVSGQPFGPYLRENGLGPLGMEHAVATDRDFARERPALGHVDSDRDRFGLGWSVGTFEGTGERMVWKSGSLPGHDAMVVMLPDGDRAVIVLQNAFQLLRAQEFHHAALGTARILSGADPGRVATDPLAPVLPWATAALAGALTLCVAAPVLRVLPARRAAARARSRHRIVLNTAGAVAASLTLAALLWWVLPAALGGTIESALLWLPDAGWGAVGGVALALLLAAERTALAVWDLGRTRPGAGVGSDGLLWLPPPGACPTVGEDERSPT